MSNHKRPVIQNNPTMVQTTFSDTVSSCPAEWWPTFFHTVMKIRFQKHTLRADSWSRWREMKTTLCTADDHCHLSSFQVSSSGSTHWLNRGKCAGWHSSSNDHRLTCYHRNKQSSVQSYRYWSLPCGQKISAFQQISHFSQLCGFTLSCLSELVYEGSRQS